MSYYVRNLPHWQPDGVPFFVTWRLFGSMPNKTGRETSIDFAAYETNLDAAKVGPVWLMDGRIAQVVADALVFGERELRQFDLDAWVIMPNHVHVVMLPSVPLATITKTLKGFTGKRANQILERNGPFWQDESYDHWIRDRYHLASAVQYVEWNPVKAGFVDRAEEWRWSSAWLGGRTGQETCATADTGRETCATRGRETLVMGEAGRETLVTRDTGRETLATRDTGRETLAIGDTGRETCVTSDVTRGSRE
jgi:putative transposase